MGVAAPIVSGHTVDPVSNTPAAATTTAIGLSITWNTAKVGSQPANGCTVETAIAVVIDRLKFYQKPAKIARPEFDKALLSLQNALDTLKTVPTI